MGIYAQTKKHIWRLRELGLGLLFPRRCPICDEIAPVGEKICLDCIKKVKYTGSQTCMRCGKPVESKRVEYCYDCSRKQHNFCQGKSVFLYAGGMKESMYRFKYQNKREYADFYAAEAMQLYGKWLHERQVEVIVPIPMYTAKKRLRGYNQAEVFAEALGRESGIPVKKNLAERIRNTVPQKKLNDIDRKKNLKGAFKISQDIVKYKKVLLVDDIYTTGSTMDAVAGELRTAGIDKIYFLCISIGQGC